MKKSIAGIVIGLTAGLGLIENAVADDRALAWSPIGIGLAEPVQFPSKASDVYGLRFGGFWGSHADVYGLDIGLAECSAERFAGLQVAALVNMVGEEMMAFQVAPVNVVRGDGMGLQTGVVNYDGATFIGLQLGGLNWNNGPSYGLQVSAINVNRDEYDGVLLSGFINDTERLKGFACGLFNLSYEVTGCQLGLINACDRMKGVQIGFLNLICESPVPIMPLANASF